MVAKSDGGAVLVTGGAGYIGAHVVAALIEAGLDPVVVDDLSSGHREFVPASVPFAEFNILETNRLAELIAEHAVTSVIHLAAFKYAGVSVTRPRHTWEQNVGGTLSLLAAMAKNSVQELVFSSTAAVYGTTDVELVTETTETRPESPYGHSKLASEQIIADESAATRLRSTSLRYFNVVGSGSDDLYDSSPHNLFPLVMDALVAGRQPMIFGDDYPTPDGTCVRDYVHVADLAAAHVVALRRMRSGERLEPVYNLGSGDGVSVKEIMAAVAAVTNISIKPAIEPRRAGDPPRIVASGELAARDLDWRMRHDITQMVSSAWAARNARER